MTQLDRRAALSAAIRLSNPIHRPFHGTTPSRRRCSAT
jgi:hypothetical protein